MELDITNQILFGILIVVILSVVISDLTMKK
jgi:hypothetical protein